MNKQSNIARFLERQATENPQALAFLDRRNASKANKSFQWLNQNVNKIANYLIDKGISKNTKTLIMLRPGKSLILYAFALFKIGAIPIIIDPGMGLKSFLSCVHHTKPKAFIGIPLVYYSSYLFRSAFASISVKICVHKGLNKQINKCSHKYTTTDSLASDLAAIVFTSGSTGAPKGVCYEHGMFNSQIDMIQRAYDIQPGEIDYPMLPIFALLNPALGMSTVVPKLNPSKPASANPSEIVSALIENKITNSFGSPMLWDKISNYCLKHNLTLPSLKRVLIAGAPASIELMQKMKQILPMGEAHSPYGATEALPITSISASKKIKLSKNHQNTKGTCVGTPLPGVSIKVIQKGSHNISDTLPANTIGSIIVSGPTVTRSYYNLEEVNRTSKIQDGHQTWHKMGDMGYIDSEGNLWFCCREVEAIALSNTSDEYLYTEECEPFVNTHPKVKRSALALVTQEGKNIISLFIEPQRKDYPKNAYAQKAFIQEIKNWIAPHPWAKHIKHIYLRKTFPVDVRHNAKIHRLKLGKSESY